MADKCPFRHRLFLAGGCLLMAMLAGCSRAPKTFTAGSVSYKSDVQVLLQGTCRCHVDNPTPPGQLNLTTYEDLMKGGRSGPQVMPARPDSSNLYNRAKRGEMPPTSPLADEDIRTLRRWIEQGAKNN
jgi:hypothetical protein